VRGSNAYHDAPDKSHSASKVRALACLCFFALIRVCSGVCVCLCLGELLRMSIGEWGRCAGVCVCTHSPCATPPMRKHRGGCLGLSHVTKGVLVQRGGGAMCSSAQVRMSVVQCVCVLFLLLEMLVFASVCERVCVSVSSSVDTRSAPLHIFPPAWTPLCIEVPIWICCSLARTPSLAHFMATSILPSFP